MNKLLTLVFLGLLLAILRFSAPPASTNRVAGPAAPARYESLPALFQPAARNPLNNRVSTDSRRLFATQRQQAKP